MRKALVLTALSVEPEMEQVFIACPDHISNPDDFERKLFVLRNYAAHTIRNTAKKMRSVFMLHRSLIKLSCIKGSLPVCSFVIIFLILE